MADVSGMVQLCIQDQELSARRFFLASDWKYNFILVGKKMGRGRKWQIKVVSAGISALNRLITGLRVRWWWSYLLCKYFHSIKRVNLKCEQRTCQCRLSPRSLSFSLTVSPRRLLILCFSPSAVGSLVLARQRTPRRSSSTWLLWPPPTKARRTAVL